MALKKYSKFVYGFKIDESNNTLDFKEDGGTTLTANLNIGDYTLTTIAPEIKRALEDAGAKIYTVMLDRAARKYTITCDAGTFSLLPVGGPTLGTSVFPLLGFTINKTNVVAAQSDVGAGFIYSPQFWLQDFVPSSSWPTSVDAVVNRAANGRVQIVRFGREYFTEFNIKYVTNCPSTVGYVRNDPQGYENLLAFMNFCIDKGFVEFYPDESSLDYESILLESTPFDSKGTGFKLIELYGRGLPEYYETGIIKFKVLEL